MLCTSGGQEHALHLFRKGDNRLVSPFRFAGSPPDIHAFPRGRTAPGCEGFRDERLYGDMQGLFLPYSDVRGSNPKVRGARQGQGRPACRHRGLCGAHAQVKARACQRRQCPLGRHGIHKAGDAGGGGGGGQPEMFRDGIMGNFPKILHYFPFFL